MASNYPGSLDSFDTIASDKKTSDSVGGRTHRAMHNDLGDAIEAIETELGTTPSGSYATVKARFEAIEGSTLPQVDAKGDLIVGTADNTYDNLGVGTNDTVLLAASGETKGVKWAQVPTAGIADDAVTADKIAADAVGSSEIAANAVGSSELADNAVDTAALADGSVTSAKIAGRALTALTPDAVLSSNLGPAIGSWTAVGSATFSTGTWTVPTGSGISATIAAVTDATIYQVDVTQSAGAPLTVTLGSVTQIFGAWQNSVTVVSSGTGSQTLTVTVGSAASITGVTVRSVITPASPIGLGQVEARLRAYNNAIGVNAQRNLTTGTYNNAIGVDAQYNLTTGAYNNAIGVNAQYNLTTGGHNNAIGVNAQYNLTTGTYNNAIGVNAQYNLTTGSYNTALGHSAGSNITVQSGTVCIGVDYSGTAAQASADNDFVLGTGLHKVLIPGSLETTGNDKGVIVRSPNGTRWRLGVSNAGAVTVVAA